jgi:transcriptional regulator with XRE-family HTH domain
MTTPLEQQRRAVLGHLLRAQRGDVSQTAFGALIGLNKQTICRLENAQHSIVLENLWRVADKLGIPLSEFIKAVEDEINARNASDSATMCGGIAGGSGETGLKNPNPDRNGHNGQTKGTETDMMDRTSSANRTRRTNQGGH